MSLHVVLGAGPVGRAVAVELLGLGCDVRMVSRSGTAVDGASAVRVDAVRDAAGLAAAVRGSAAVYQVMNPAYTRWAADFPPLQEAAIAAARGAGARLVVMDNLYAWGRADSGALDESSALHPASRKGRIRARVAERLWGAHAAGDVEAVAGHASDYFGAGAGKGTALGDEPFQAVVSGRPAWLMGDPDRLHSYSYLPDIGRGLAALGTAGAAAGRRWFLPVASQPWSTRQMLERAAGGSARVRAVPSALVRAAGVVVPLARELAEMAYEFDADYVVDASRIEALGIRPTPLEAAVDTTAEAARRSLSASVGTLRT